MKAALGPSGPTVQALLLGAWLAGCADAQVFELTTRPLDLDAPPALDLGTIPTEEPARGRFVLENVGEQTVELRGVRAISLTPEVTIDATADVEVLPPGGTAEISVVELAGARPPSDRLGTVSFDVRGLASDDLRIPVVEVIAAVSPSGLAVEPNPLAIGPVLYTDTGTGALVLRNLRQGGGPLTVYAMRYERVNRTLRAQYEEALTRGSFGPLPPVDADGRLVTLGPGERWEIVVAYTAPNGPGEAKEQAVWRITTCPEQPEACEQKVIIQGLPDVEAPVAQVVPFWVHFGPTPVDELVERALTVTNRGLRPLIIEDVRLSGSDQMTVDAEALEGASVPGGAQVETIVTYRPRTEALHNAELQFRTNDPLKRNASVRISGAGVVLPPCVFDVTPSRVDFGAVEVGEAEVREVRVRNGGRQACVMFDPRIVPNAGTEDSAFTFVDPPRASFRLSPGEQTVFEVRFAPPGLGPRSAVLRLRTSEGQNIEVPLTGQTPDRGGLVCTAEQVTQPERPVTLNAVLTGAAVALDYRWQVVSAPGGGSWRLSPNPPTGPSADLTPLMLGTYLVEVQVRTEAGDSLSCNMTVTAVSTGLRVTMTWDGSGDLDLHLRQGRSSRWYSDDDCYFENMTPLWVQGESVGNGPNPRLDRDDTSGDGPENIQIAAPTIGLPYTIAVSHFRDAAGRTARILAYCGRVSSVLDISSRPFRGQSTGNCTSNDFWTVATLTFTAPDQCDVEVVDAIRTTLDACQAP